MTKTIMEQFVKGELPEWRKPVLAIPLNQAFPALGEVKEFKNKVCLFNHNRTQIFDVVSNRYHLIPHGDIYDTVETTLRHQFGKVESKVQMFNEGSRMKVTFTLPDVPKVDIGNGDLVALQLKLFNSYDRFWFLRVILGALRLVCTNGMTIGVKFGSFTTRHIGMIADPAYYMQNVARLINMGAYLQDVWREWRETPVDDAESRTMLVDILGQKYTDKIMAGRPANRWDFYNAITACISHEVKSAQRQNQLDEKISRLFYQDMRLPHDEPIDAEYEVCDAEKTQIS